MSGGVIFKGIGLKLGPLLTLGCTCFNDFSLEKVNIHNF